MKPTNVIRHEHFFPNDNRDGTDDQRVDACELADGSFVVWVLANDSTISCTSWDEACNRAREKTNL